MHSDQVNAASQDDLPDAIPESLLLPSNNKGNCTQNETEKQPNSSENDEIQFESLESEVTIQEAACANDNVLREDSCRKDTENTLSEPDQPECDINSNSDGSEIQKDTGHDSVQIETAQTVSVTFGTTDCSGGAGSSLASTLDIPRVSSHDELGKIQDSVQALIDKTSGFLDSDPPSTMSSMSDLDQAGLDALSSTKLFDTARLDTPSPRAQSPQQNTNSSQSSSVMHSQASSSGAQQQSSASHDSSCLPANVNSINVQTTSKASTQISDTDEDLLSQLDAELDSNNDNNRPSGQNVESGDAENPNGLIQRNINLTQIPEYKKLLAECEMLRKQTDEQQQKIKRYKRMINSNG